MPLVGPITYYLPVRDGRPCTDGLKGELRLIVEAEIGVALFGAVGTDDPVLFDTVLKDIADYPSRYGTPEAKLAVEIVMVWIRNFLHASSKCPEWLVNFDLASIPEEWRRQVCYLAVECLHRKGEYKAAAILAEALLNLDPKMALERALAAGAPELLARIKKLTNGYFRNLVKYHNRYTGDSVTEDLRPREFYIAGLVKHGVSYKEIAERTGMSDGRVRNTISEIYDILHVGRGAEIGDQVW